jgi:DNA polymerase I-like protein with 3'-5' exonuclease and polymerase domains
MVALEPTLALLIDGQRCPEDVYSHISEKVLGGQVARPEAKITTICAIYGISALKLSQKLPKGVDAKRVLGDVRSYLNITGLLLKLRAESSSGYIKNFYGRRIAAQEDSPLVNYYLQSTGVDASLLAFGEFDKISEGAGHKISKKGVIHDALVFTCEKSSISELSSIASSIPIPGIGNLRAKIKEIV